MRAEDGFGLIEVLASALVVVMVTIATYGALDSASRASGRSKAKAIAASLAQQEQERLRGLRASDLAAFDSTTSKVVDGVTYTMRSQGVYTQDSYDSNGCTATGRVDYVKIVTTVSWPSMGTTRPVRIESLVHPPSGSLNADQGALGVQILNAAGGPVTGLMVNVAGPASYSKPTDSNGCVFFPVTPAGQYTVSYGAAGWVDPAGNSSVSFNATVSGEHLTFYQKNYAPKGRIVATYKTNPTSALWPQAPGWPRLTASHSGPDYASSQTGNVVDNLFPFTSAYNVYAGDCDLNVLPASLVSQLPVAQSYEQTDLVTAGDNAVDLFVPSFYVRVYRKNSTGGDVALTSTPVTIKAKPSNAGCGTGYTVSGTTNGSAELRFAVPYNSYSLCVSATVNGLERRYTLGTPRVNDQYNPGTTQRIDMMSIPWTGGTGACP